MSTVSLGRQRAGQAQPQRNHVRTTHDLVCCCVLPATEITYTHAHTHARTRMRAHAMTHISGVTPNAAFAAGVPGAGGYFSCTKPPNSSARSCASLWQSSVVAPVTSDRIQSITIAVVGGAANL